MKKSKIALMALLSFFTMAFSEPKKVTLVGIAGGTGSGKTYLAEKLHKTLGSDVTILSQDCYYKGVDPNFKLDHRQDVNFDHPDAIDFQLLAKHLKDLKANQKIEVPVYDFKTSSRKEETISLEPKKIVVVEGILLFCMPEIRELFDLKIFVDTDDDLRVLRRFHRDTKERGRTVDTIYNQYLKTVYPMHKQFVVPSKEFADLIIKGNHDEDLAIDKIVQKIAL